MKPLDKLFDAVWPPATALLAVAVWCFARIADPTPGAAAGYSTIAVFLWLASTGAALKLIFRYRPWLVSGDCCDITLTAVFMSCGAALFVAILACSPLIGSIASGFVLVVALWFMIINVTSDLLKKQRWWWLRKMLSPLGLIVAYLVRHDLENTITLFCACLIAELIWTVDCWPKKSCEQTALHP